MGADTYGYPFFMAQVITDLDSAIDLLNTLYNGSSTPPSSGEEDYEVWTDLLNIGINIWEQEDGQRWLQLFIELADAADGDKTTDGTNSYTLPTLFSAPNSAYVWIGTGTSKTPYKVIDIRDKQLYENNSERWCYFTPTTLEFNPNITMDTGSTISYNFYKKASSLSSGSSVFEMSDPMFAVYYALSELKKEEGDTSALTIATQKLAAMVTKNESQADHQDSQLINPVGDGFGL
jgi:hypothetical protein